MATEFVCSVGPGQTDYTSLQAWDTGVACDLTSASTMVFGGTETNTLADNDTVTGSASSATGTVVSCTNDQLLLEGISGTFQSGERIEKDGDATIYFTTSDAGDSAIAVAECATSGAVDGRTTIDGWTTNATNYIIIRAASGHEAQQPINTTRYRLYVSDADNTNLLSITEPYSKFQHIQLIHDGSGQWSDGVSFTGGELECDACVFDGTGSSGVNQIGLLVNNVTEQNNTVINNVSFGWGQHGYSLVSSAYTAIDCINNTSYGNTQDGIFCGWGDLSKCKNNLSYNNTLDDFDGNTKALGTFEYNFSKDDTAGSANNCIRGDTDGQYPVFISTAAASENFHIGITSDAIGAGHGPSADADVPTTDFDNNSRVGSVISIGAFEGCYVGGTATGPAPVADGDISTAAAAKSCSGTGVGGAPVVAGTILTTRLVKGQVAAGGVPVGTGKVLTKRIVKGQVAAGGAPVASGTISAAARTCGGTAVGPAPVATGTTKKITLVTCTVDPGGTGDYTTLSSAEAANFTATGVDLVSNDEKVKCTCICTNSAADTTACTIDGFTTDAGHNILIEVDADYRWQHKWPGTENIYRMDGTDQASVLRVDDDNVTIRGMAARNTPSNNFYSVYRVENSQNVLHDQCLGVVASNASDGCKAFYDNNCTTGTNYWRNCLGYETGGGNLAHLVWVYNRSGGTALFYNCTMVDGDEAFRVSGTTATSIARNCVGWATSPWTGNWTGGDYNGADDSSPPGANDITIASADFANYASQDFRVKDPDSALYNAAPTLYADSDLTVTVDFEGDARPSTGNACIGFDELHVEKPTGTAIGPAPVASGTCSKVSVTKSCSGTATGAAPTASGKTLAKRLVKGQVATGVAPVASGTAYVQTLVSGIATGPVPIVAGKTLAKRLVAGTATGGAPVATGAVTEPAKTCAGTAVGPAPTATGKTLAKRLVSGIATGAAPIALGTTVNFRPVSGTGVGAAPVAAGKILTKRFAKGTATGAAPVATGSVFVETTVSGVATGAAPVVAGKVLTKRFAKGTATGAAPTATGLGKKPGDTVSGVATGPVPAGVGKVLAKRLASGVASGGAPGASGLIVTHRFASGTGVGPPPIGAGAVTTSAEAAAPPGLVFLADPGHYYLVVSDCEDADQWTVALGDATNEIRPTPEDPSRGTRCLIVDIEDKDHFLVVDHYSVFGVNMIEENWLSAWIALDEREGFNGVDLLLTTENGTTFRVTPPNQSHGGRFYSNNQWKEGWNYKLFNIGNVYVVAEHLTFSLFWEPGYEGKWIKFDELRLWTRADVAEMDVRLPSERVPMKAGT